MYSAWFCAPLSTFRLF